MARQTGLRQGFGMEVRRVAAVATLPCLCFTTAEAGAQSRRSAAEPPVVFELRPYQPPLVTNQRVQEDTRRPTRVSGMLGTLTVTENAEIGIGRFGVGTIARARTNLERERMMERENRNIAGAGMRVRF